ncbi:MAG: hypothetical protein QOE61_425 [Micromonosporaceae bacterium]|nr:hypothetical protein [Micromonosporaceae bacterium]
MGSGQFCTKPALLFLSAEHGLTDALVAQTTAVELGPLLNRRIQDGFSVMADELARTAGVRRLTPPSIVESPGDGVSSVLLAVSAADLIRATTLLEECLGPAAPWSSTAPWRNSSRPATRATAYIGWRHCHSALPTAARMAERAGSALARSAPGGQLA